MAKSIMHDKRDRTCYLCMLLDGDRRHRTGLEEHHIFPGTANRRLSEKYGLKVYLCMWHHTAGPKAAHNDIDVCRMLQKKAQEEFEKAHSRDEWMRIFGRNYI